MKLVYLESPYAGDVKKNLKYAKLCMKDCFNRDESPFVSHILFTGVLNDNIPSERELGIQLGFAYRLVCEKTVVYVDLGISKGMVYGIEHSEKNNIPLEYRSIVGSRTIEDLLK